MTIDHRHTAQDLLTSVVNSPAELRGVTSRWRAKAACRDEDPEFFFPIGTTGLALNQIERAKEVCARCLVRRQCLQWALDTHQPTGIWGGRDEVERRALRRIQRVRK